MNLFTRKSLWKEMAEELAPYERLEVVDSSKLYKTTFGYDVGSRYRYGMFVKLKDSAAAAGK